ncbi:MAG: hypothetical protein AB7R40_23815 [Nitrospiraceae bacterium]
MLYDPKWEQRDKTNPKYEYAGVELHAFIAWLERQNPHTQYDFCNARTCAVAQYLLSIGHPEPEVDFMPCTKKGDPGFWLEEIVIPTPTTFGAALKRARKLAAS